MLICYFDGACEPVNPGGTASYGAVAFSTPGDSDTLGRLWEGYGVYIPLRIGETSNNLAEYLGFRAVLRWLSTRKSWLAVEPVVIYGDSKLVVEQMNKRWRIRGGCYTPLAEECKWLLTRFGRTPRIEWIPREQNTEADRLSKKALVEAGIRPKRH